MKSVFTDVYRKTDKTKQLIYLAVILFVISLLITYIINKIIKNGKFICEGYVFNTYIYIILSLLSVAIMNLILEYNKYGFNLTYMNFLGLIIIMLVSLTSLQFIKNDKLLLKHIVWLIFVLCSGLMFYPMYILSQHSKTYISALFTLVSMIFLITSVVFIKPEMVSLKIGPILFWLLLIGIIMESLSYFIIKGNIKLTHKLFSYVFLIIFSLYVIYDTKILKENAKICDEGKGADYIKESISLFLDITNIFSRIIGLKVTK